MKIVCVPQFFIERIIKNSTKISPDKWNLISIATEKIRPQNLEKLHKINCNSILKLDFDDIVEPYPSANLVLFNDDHAKEILNWIDLNKDLDLLIHCHAGVSRSGAVGVFLMKYLNLDENLFKLLNQNIYPNHHILNVLNRVSGKEFSFDPFWINNP